MERDTALQALLASIGEGSSTPSRSRTDAEKGTKDRTKRRSQEPDQEEGKRPKRDPEPVPRRRPDFSTRHWRAGEIRIEDADGVSVIPTLDWAAIEFKVMEAMADLTDDLRKKTQLPVSKLGSRKLYYDRDLKCGILEVKDADRLLPIRDLLANSIKHNPRLQLLTKYDRLTPIVTNFAPRVYNGLTDDRYVRHLIDHNEVLQSQPFKVFSVTHVEYIARRSFRLQHLHNKIQFDKRIEKLVPPVGRTVDMNPKPKDPQVMPAKHSAPLNHHLMNFTSSVQVPGTSPPGPSSKPPGLKISKMTDPKPADTESQVTFQQGNGPHLASTAPLFQGEKPRTPRKNNREKEKETEKEKEEGELGDSQDEENGDHESKGTAPTCDKKGISIEQYKARLMGNMVATHTKYRPKPLVTSSLFKEQTEKADRPHQDDQNPAGKTYALTSQVHAQTHKTFNLFKTHPLSKVVDPITVDLHAAKMQQRAHMASTINPQVGLGLPFAVTETRRSHSMGPQVSWVQWTGVMPRNQDLRYSPIIPIFYNDLTMLRYRNHQWIIRLRAQLSNLNFTR
jgi:hypothetical protein